MFSSLKEIKNTSPKVLLKIINKIKFNIKKDEVWIKICKEYDEDVNIIDLIPTRFGKLDVSAKTEKGIIILNNSLLFSDDYNTEIGQYLLHEYSHWFQQCYGEKPTQSSDDGDYLKNPHEQEAFQNQVEYLSNHKGKEEAENYVDDLLDHHDKEGKEKKELEKVLLKKV